MKTKVESSEYSKNSALKTLAKNERNLKISLKSAEDLYPHDRVLIQDLNNEGDKYSIVKIGPDQFNGISLLDGTVLPTELERSIGGVFAKSTIFKGTKYGPFKGKWASVPQNPKYAWEVSNFFFLALRTRKTVKQTLMLEILLQRDTCEN